MTAGTLAVAVTAAMLAASPQSSSPLPDIHKPPVDIRRPPPHDHGAERHPTSKEMSDPSWRPWLRWEWCTDARGVRFRCQR
jgi:hypothetical protein